MKRILFVLALLYSCLAAGQNIDKNRLAEKVGGYMKRVGPMEGATISAIIDSVRKGQFNEVETAYAIYYWITNNIAFDSRAFHHRRQANLSASSALTERKAISEGYAALFKAMCDIARIECIAIDGFAKPHPAFIGAVDDDARHSWNAVNVKNTWYFVDATWGAGVCNEHFRNFEKQFTDAWFFTKRSLFTLSHYPANKKFQLTDEPVTRSVFNNALTIHAGAVVGQVFPDEEQRGTIRGTEEDCKRIVFEMQIPEKILKAEVVADGRRMPADIYKQGNVLSVDLPLAGPGHYPVVLYLNGTPAFGFMADVSKRKRS